MELKASPHSQVVALLFTEDITHLTLGLATWGNHFFVAGTSVINERKGSCALI